MAGDDRTVIGLRTGFFGFQFSLVAAPLRTGVVAEFEAECYRPAGLTELRSRASVRFAWKDRPYGREVPGECVPA
jgi:hypothetical protein